MTWPGFSALAGAWLFLLLVPLIIFYFLKLKRPRKELPSLALWRSVMNDRRVNSPFQRFKRNLLLLLQILLLLFLVVAAMQPFWPSGAERAQYLPVLIDCSASMAALDKAGGQSRLDAAKEEVTKLIDNLLPEQRLSLIAVSSSARRLTEFTDNKRILRDALSQLHVSQVTSQLEDGLRMTQALARTVPVETAVMFTDGNVPAEIDFELPFQLNYQRLPPAGANVGITALNARRAASHWDVFVRVEATKVAAVATDVQLLQDGKPAGEESISLEPGQSQRLAFRVEAERPSAIEIRLKPAGFDALESDNVAFLDLPVSRPLTAYCPTELAAFRHALAGIEGVVVYPDDQQTSNSPASYDLVISDQAADAAREALVSLFVGVIPEELKKQVTIETDLAIVVDWQRSAPVLQHVQLSEVQITDRPTSAEGVSDRDYEKLGYEVLAHTRTGPLVLKKETGAKSAYYFLFHTDRSTLTYRVGFPILVANFVQIAMSRAELSEVRAVPTGILPPQTLRPGTSYNFTAPDGESHEFSSNADGVVSGVPAPIIGRYTATAGSSQAASIGVSLLSPTETSLAGVDQLQFREIAVGAAESLLKNDRPLWPWFAGLAFCFLLVEWWVYQRRPV